MFTGGLAWNQSSWDAISDKWAVIVKEVNQAVDGGRAPDPAGSTDGGQGWVDVTGKLNIVKTHDGNVLGGVQVTLLHCFHKTNCHLVIGTKHGFGQVMGSDDHPGHVVTGFLREIAVIDLDG